MDKIPDLDFHRMRGDQQTCEDQAEDGYVHCPPHRGVQAIFDRRRLLDHIFLQSCEGELLEAKRRALWSALVDVYVETGSRLGEAQIEADRVMDSVSEEPAQDDGEGQAAALSEIDR